MTVYPCRCRRSSPEPLPATIRLLHHRAPSSRPTSATSTVPRHLGETHYPSPCPTHAPWSPLACAGHLLPPRPPVSRHRSRHHVGSRRGDRPDHAPSAPRRPGLAGLQWMWAASRLSRLAQRHRLCSECEAHGCRRLSAECEAQYCATVLIIFQFI
jgi:hypothetical protein